MTDSSSSMEDEMMHSKFLFDLEEPCGNCLKVVWYSKL